MRPNRQLAVLAAAMSANPREAMAASRSAGFEGLIFDAISPGLDVTEFSQTGRREFSRLLSSSDQQLVALRIDAGPKGMMPGADVDRLLARLGQVMEAAKALATRPMVCFDVGPLPEPAAEEKPMPRVTPQQAGLLIIPEMSAPAAQTAPAGPGPDASVVSHVDGALRELGTFADRIGVTIAIRSELSSFAAIERALAAAGCPWLAVDLDPAAMLRDGWPADEIFSRLGPLVRHVRGRDAIVGADRRTKPAIIGQGSVDWAKLLPDLDGAGFRGWITIDPMELPDRRAAAIAGAKYLKTSVP